MTLLVQLGPRAVEALSSEPLHGDLHRTVRKQRGPEAAGFLVFVDAIGFDTSPVLALFCKPAFEPGEFLHIHVSSLAPAHPSPLPF